MPLNVTMLAPGKARVEIYNLIGPSAAGMTDTQEVADKLKKAGPLSEIEIHINSPGGDAFEGLGINRVLKSHSAKKTVIIDGVAASAASLIVMAGDIVKIPKNGSVMIHGPRKSTFLGSEDDHRISADTLAAVTDQAVQTYVSRTGQQPEQIAAWMKAETWFVGQQAVDAGFADEVIQDAYSVTSRAAVEQVYQQTPGFVALTALAMDPERMAQDAPYRAEYAADRALYMQHNITEEDYIASRRMTAEREA